MNNQQQRSPYLFLSPFFAIFFLFWLWPLLYSIYLSVTQWSGVGWPKFNGIENYVWLFQDKVFLRSVWNTIIIATASIAVIMPLALFLAVVLNNPLTRFRNAFRFSIFLPASMSLVVASLIFLNMLDPNYGLLRFLVGWFGIKMPDILASETGAMVMLICILTWRWTGYNMLFFLAALQSIPKDVIEAARIDGANRFQTFWHITLPMLKPITVFVLVQSLIGAFQVFEEPLIITGGGPANATLTMALYLYNKAFRGSEFGYASTIALFQFVLIAVLCAIALKVTGALKAEKA